VNDEKKKLLSVLTVILVIAIIAGFFYNYILSIGVQPWGYSFEKNINFEYNTPDELTAIGKAEFLNYSAIFGIEKYTHNQTPNITNNWYAARAQYIDKIIVDYYKNKLDYQQRTGVEVHVQLNYTVKAGTEDTLKLEIVKDKWGHDIIIGVNESGVNATYWRVSNFNQCYVALYNNTEYLIIDPVQINFTITQCYSVEMYLSYGEGYGPVGAHTFGIYQLVIFDKDYNTKFIFIDEGWDVCA